MPLTDSELAALEHRKSRAQSPVTFLDFLKLGVPSLITVAGLIISMYVKMEALASEQKQFQQQTAAALVRIDAKLDKVGDTQQEQGGRLAVMEYRVQRLDRLDPK